MHYFEGRCVCLESFYFDKGKCVRCPIGEYYVNDTCVLLCGSNEIVNSNGKCICREGYGKHINNVCSICPSNTQLVNGYCVSCPIGSKYNPQTSRCDCIIGYTLTLNGFCKSLCQVNE